MLLGLELECCLLAGKDVVPALDLLVPRHLVALDRQYFQHLLLLIGVAIVLDKLLEIGAVCEAE